MSLKDQFNNYRQKKEAQDYFRTHNNYRLSHKDYPILIGTGLIVGVISGAILAFIELRLSISFSVLYLLVGYVMAISLAKATQKEGPHLGVAAAIMTLVAFYLKEVCSALMMYASLGMNFSILKIFVLGLAGLTHNSLISWLFVLAGMYVAYNKSL